MTELIPILLLIMTALIAYEVCRAANNLRSNDAEIAAIRAGLEDIKAGRVHKFTTVRDLLESEENNHER